MKCTPILTGPTAAGKTSFALELAQKFELEIINADSLLVYRHFNIGTAKPTPDELRRARHHLVDILEPEETYTAAEFTRDVEKCLSDLDSQGKRAIIVGGTPFYLKALTLGLWDAPATQPEYRGSLESESTDQLFQRLIRLDPTHAKKVGSSDRYRIIRGLEILTFSNKKPSELEHETKNREPNPRFPIWVLDRSTDDLKSRIQIRTEEMLRSGLIEEAERLLQVHPQARALRSVGYDQVVQFLKGSSPSGRKPKPGIEGLSEEIQLATRQLTKAQKTFFRSLKSCQWFLFEEDRPKLLNIAKEIFEEAK